MNQHTKNFIDTVNSAAKSSSRGKIFSDFLTCSAAALNRDEQTFANVEDKQLHVKLFGELAGAIEDSISVHVLRDKKLGINYRYNFPFGVRPKYRDIIGEIFCELELYDQDAGQVFTPMHIADIMGETTITPELVKRELHEHGFVSIVENCCGSGALILGALNALLKLNVNPCQFARVRAIDLDERCVLMTFIQLSLYGIPAVVVRQDAVTGQTCGSPLVTPIMRYRHEK